MSEGGATADSYIGSLISLTSKSEIRYEGVLYTVDTANSNIALQNVRSFGTEGRKKDGPQIPQSDKVYDYIIFRGSDIKDLQVKMSPPVRPIQSQQLHHDPAIISLRPQTSPMVPPPVVSTSSSSATTTPSDTIAAETPTDVKTFTNNPSVVQSNVPPLYQPQGSWAMQQIPQANMYWAGYYRPQVGISYFQQQSQLPFQAPPMMPPSYASQSQFPTPHQQTVAASISPSTSTITSSVQVEAMQMMPNTNDLVVALPKLTAPQLTEVSDVQSTTSLTSAMERKVLNTVAEASIPQTSIAEESLNVASKGSQRVSLSASLSGDSGKELDFVSCSMTSEQNLQPILPNASTSQAHSSVNEPLLPLPVNPLRHRQVTQVHGTSAYARRGRGRGRGEGMSVIHTQYTEDFNFTEMNEKFNKDEVWGELGKSNSRDKGEGEEDASELDYHHEEEGSYRTSVYVKDDFFDMLSSDTGRQNGKMKFSEQQKIDAETFGRGSVRSYGGRSNGYHHRGGDYRGRGYYGNRGDRNRGQGQNYSRRIYY